VTRLASLVGVAGTLAGTAATLGCCGLGILGPTAALVAGSGSAALVPSTWEYPVVYVSLVLALAGLLMNGRRHRRPGPGILGALGALLLLLALHEAWDVAVFAALIGGGSAILGAAVAFDMAQAWHLCRRSLEESR
jgi:hypothetical protein